jgi:glutamate formiminotransferase
MEADKRGVGVVESELIGLVPHDALVQIAEQKQIRDARALSTDALAQIAREALILPGLGAGQVVETRILGE